MTVIAFPRKPAKRAGVLTVHQRKCLLFVQRYQREHDGAWPSYAEIGAELKLKAKLGPVRVLYTLFSAGALTRPMSERKWQVPPKSKVDGWYEIPIWIAQGGAVPYPRNCYTLKDGTVVNPEEWIEEASGVLRKATQ